MKLRNRSKNPAPGTKKYPLSAQTGDWLAREQLFRRAPGVLAGNKVNRNQQCAPAATKARHMLGCIGKDNSQELGEMGLLLFLTPRRLHLEHHLI